MTSYIYLVLPIPSVTSAFNSYFKYWEDGSGNGGCQRAGEYCYATETKNINVICKCAAATINVVTANQKSFNCFSSSCPNIYTYMLGTDQGGQQPTSLIPSIGGYLPHQITSPTTTIMGDFAGFVYLASGETPGGYNPYAIPGYIVLAYEASWVTSWTDLDVLAPPNYKDPSTGVNYPFGGTNPYNIQNTKGTINSTIGTNSWQVQGAGGQPSASVIPYLEDQFITILQSFCIQTSSSCPAGVNPGIGTCSNFLAQLPAGQSNYCNIGMLNDIPPVGSSGPFGLDASMTAYCQAASTEKEVLSECFCVLPTMVPNNAFCDLTGFGTECAGTPQSVFGSAGISPSTAGPLQCWWEPCIAAASGNALIPSGNLPGVSSCPNICEQINQAIATGGGTIIYNNDNVQQTLGCCSTGTNCSTCTADSNCASGETCVSGSCQSSSPPPPPSGTCQQNSDCASGQQCINNNCSTPAGTSCSDSNPCPAGQTCSSSGQCFNPAPSGCSTNTDCPSGSICTSGNCVKQTFWDKYKLAIIIAFVIVIFAIILLILLWLFK